MNKPLKKKEMEEFQDLLNEKKQRILHHLANISEDSEQSLTQGIATGDSADLASMEISQASLQKIGKREQQLLKKIDLALKKIDGGTYGICEECEEPIGLGRLRARPEAQLCIDCKTEQENEERKFSSHEPRDDDDDEGGSSDSDDSE